MASPYCVVYVTAPHSAAQKIGRALLEARLAACVGVVPEIVTYYWWKKKLHRGRELMLIIKTRRAHLPRLEAMVTRMHPYDVPEIISLPILRGNKPYLDWLKQETRRK
jgi:periplasmic divalent cation tolerance protein